MKRIKGIWFENIDKNKWTESFPKISIYEQMEKTALKFPSLPAISFQNKTYTFKNIIEIIDRLSKALISIGIKKGDIVSIISPNTPQGVCMFYAINKISAVANMIHPLLSSNEIQHLIESTDSVAVFTMDVVYSKISDIKWKDKFNPKIIIGQVRDALNFPLNIAFKLKEKNFPELNNKHNNIYWNKLLKIGGTTNIIIEQNTDSSESLAVILYSGGTTGIQKGVMLTNYNFTCYAIQAFEASGMDTIGKRCLTVLPLFHGFGIALCVHTMLTAATCIYLVPTYDFNKCNRLIFKKKINFICGVPALFETLSRYPKIETQDLSFIECLISGGDILPVKLQKRLNNQLKVGGSKATIREAYGQTESVTGCCINPDFNNVMGSVGLPCPDIESKIVEIGTCNELENGKDGELCLYGPNIMLGYYNDKAATEKALKLHSDGKIWLHTGDIFCKSDDGYLFFKQRMSRMIVCAGYNVYLSKIENCINECTVVSQSCAVDIKDRVLGSRIGLYVILKENINEQEGLEAVKYHCEKFLSEYEIPMKIIFTKEFPYTKIGKIDFKALEMKINRRSIYA